MTPERRSTIAMAARSPAVRRATRCLIGCLFAAVSAALDHTPAGQSTVERRGCT
jgi:hypothetical protein